MPSVCFLLVVGTIVRIQLRRKVKMAVIEELIRLEEDGRISFGNYLMDE